MMSSAHRTNAPTSHRVVSLKTDHAAAFLRPLLDKIGFSDGYGKPVHN